VWFNEHYANRIGVIDANRGLLTEYSLSNPPANKTTQIDNALTLGVGGNRVWFTELTANCVGYIDATQEPAFTVHVSQQRFKLSTGENVTFSLVVDGSSKVPLHMHFADSENLTSIPDLIVFNTNRTMIQPLNGEAVMNVTISTRQELKPGNYTMLVSVSDGLTNQGVYVWLQVNG
jgi:hypothetical protein